MRWVAERRSPLDAVVGRVPDRLERGWAPYPNAAPDLTDPATLGCLLRLVREARKDPGVWCEPDGGDLTRWAVYSGRGVNPRTAYGDSEAEVLVLALEAATR